MEVGKSNIFKVLDGTTQFIIPVYQRAYSRLQKTAISCGATLFLCKKIIDLDSSLDQ